MVGVNFLGVSRKDILGAFPPSANSRTELPPHPTHYFWGKYKVFFPMPNPCEALNLSRFPISNIPNLILINKHTKNYPQVIFNLIQSNKSGGGGVLCSARPFEGNDPSY